MGGSWTPWLDSPARQSLLCNDQPILQSGPQKGAPGPELLEPMLWRPAVQDMRHFIVLGRIKEYTCTYIRSYNSPRSHDWTSLVHHLEWHHTSPWWNVSNRSWSQTLQWNKWITICGLQETLQWCGNLCSSKQQSNEINYACLVMTEDNGNLALTSTPPSYHYIGWKMVNTEMMTEIKLLFSSSLY